MPNKYQKSRAKQRARAQSKINKQQALLEELKLKYSRKDRSLKLLERVNGKVRYTEQYYKMIDAYEAVQDYTAADTVKAIIAEHKKAMEMDPELESLSERSVYSRVQRTQVEKFLINSGYSAAELAAEYELNEEDILNEDNWRDGIFTFGDRVFEIKFNYMTSVLKELTGKSKDKKLAEIEENKRKREEQKRLQEKKYGLH